ncbi:SH3 domain-containing protein [uncultured Shimia sp.]|uniref:SH3 domain-containing protein n=1 Tax=uncultured Shimia sp. TaxID=573152 RepID=UPI0026087FDF|nr:SH3 domain-containing protein [uncultured Shimia sp.]
MIRLFIVALLWPMSVLAEPLPALYDVAGVAADDVLNVRAAPTGSAEKLGELLPNDKAIEVTAINAAKTWGRINLGEVPGWVSMRYMTRHEDNPDFALAHALTCYGTEPFWRADITQGQGVTIKTPETSTDFPGAGLFVQANGTPGHYAIGFGESSAQVTRSECSDGMSDRSFALRVGLFLRHDQSQTFYSGCCSITMH